MTERAIPRRAIFGWDSDAEQWVKIQVDADGKLQITSTTLDTVLSEIQNGTYGLEALKAAIDAIQAKTDNLPSDPADESAVESAISTAHSTTDAKVERKVTHMDFWADNLAQVALTTVLTADYNLSSLVVAGIPTGATIVRVVALLKIASIRDTSGSDNAINGATALKVDADSGYGSLVTAIDIADNSWAVDVSQAVERGGDVLIGDNDVKTEITGNGTFYAQLQNIGCDGNNLNLEDVAWGVRVYFY